MLSLNIYITISYFVYVKHLNDRIYCIILGLTLKQPGSDPCRSLADLSVENLKTQLRPILVSDALAYLFHAKRKTKDLFITTRFNGY